MTINYSNVIVATVLTVYGIETHAEYYTFRVFDVATVLTVYGIETNQPSHNFDSRLMLLQQYLPFTVLKHDRRYFSSSIV